MGHIFSFSGHSAFIICCQITFPFDYWINGRYHFPEWFQRHSYDLIASWTTFNRNKICWCSGIIVLFQSDTRIHWDTEGFMVIAMTARCPGPHRPSTTVLTVAMRHCEGCLVFSNFTDLNFTSFENGLITPTRLMRSIKCFSKIIGDVFPPSHCIRHTWMLLMSKLSKLLFL